MSGGNTQRLAEVPLLELSSMPAPLADRLRPRVERLGYLGDFFRIAAHQPDALAAFIDFTEHSKAAVSPWAAELVALTVASYARNDYERVQHEQLAVRLGLSVDWVRAVEELAPHDQRLLSAEQQTVQAWVLAALRDSGHGSRLELEALVKVFGAEHAVAIVLLCGRYVAHALVVNSFGIQPPVESVLGPATTS